MSKIEITLDIEKSVEFLLNQSYFSEFEVIDGMNQHPKSLNFYDWLYQKEFISKWQYDKVKKQLKEESDE